MKTGQIRYCKIIFVLLLMLYSCNESERANTLTTKANNTVNNGACASFVGTVTKLTYENHEYLIFKDYNSAQRNFSISTLHSPNCKCNKNE